MTKLGEIKQIALAVTDLDASVIFFSETLGFDLLFKAPPAMAFLDLHGIRLMLSEADEAPAGGPILYFNVDDIDKAYAKLAKKGADCAREPVMTHKTETSELWLAFFKDPDNHLLALMEERAI